MTNQDVTEKKEASPNKSNSYLPISSKFNKAFIKGVLFDGFVSIIFLPMKLPADRLEDMEYMKLKESSTWEHLKHSQMDALSVFGTLFSVATGESLDCHTMAAGVARIGFATTVTSYSDFAGPIKAGVGLTIFATGLAGELACSYMEQQESF